MRPETPSDQFVLTQISDAFAFVDKPEHFTEYTHCEECAEHDELLRSRDRSNLQLVDVGNPGWDPLCYTTPEGFAYYFPALARIALEPPTPQHDWYVPQLLFHLTYNEARNRHFLFFTPPQRLAVLNLLNHLQRTRTPLLEKFMSSTELAEAQKFGRTSADTPYTHRLGDDLTLLGGAPEMSLFSLWQSTFSATVFPACR